MGGTEKTPLAMEILRWLLERGYRPALVSRGYKGGWEKKGGVVSDGKSVLATWQQAGDEPFLIAQSVREAGVFVGKNRLSSCLSAFNLGFDIAVLDDGFQHRRVGRDLDIAIYPSPEIKVLRESRQSLGRADIILIKTSIQNPALPWLRPSPFSIRRSSTLPSVRENIFPYSVEAQGMWQLWEDKPLPQVDLEEVPLVAFCGIARPERFLSLLKTTGARVVSSIFFPDHYPYPESSIEKILARLKTSGASAAVTTEKDAVKILGHRARFGKIPVYYLKIRVHVDPGFYAHLENFLKKAAG